MTKIKKTLLTIGSIFLGLFLLIVWDLSKGSYGDFPDPLPDAENEAFFQKYFPLGVKPGYSFKVSEAWPGDWQYVCEVPVGTPADYKKSIADYFKLDAKKMQLVKYRNNEISGDQYRAYVFYYPPYTIDYLQLRIGGYPRLPSVKDDTICTKSENAIIVKSNELVRIKGQFRPFVLQSSQTQE